MSAKKTKSSKKREKKAEPPRIPIDLDEPLDSSDDTEAPLFEDEDEDNPPDKSSRSKRSRFDQDEDTLPADRENVDLLDTIDGVDYDNGQFESDFPHLTKEIQNPDLLYPVDAVRWDDEKAEEEEEEELEEEKGENKPRKDRFALPEEPNLKSLLRRSKSEKEAEEIIKYFEKRGEITPQEATKLLNTLQSKGLKALQSKSED
jgi:hypothetical protein